MAGLTHEALAAATNVGTATLTRLESEPGRLRATLVTLDSLQAALEACSVEFVEDGVRMLRDILVRRW